MRTPIAPLVPLSAALLLSACAAVAPPAPSALPAARPAMLQACSELATQVNFPRLSA